jgi:predicted ATP-grasp superfamily ATP-dependent carboligase
VAVALVTDGEQRAALAVVRSLGRAGYDVRVCSSRPRSLAGASRHCRAQAHVPDALAHPAEFAAAVRERAARWGAAFLLPVSEASLLALLPAGERPPGVCIPFPGLDAFRAISDKERVARAAARVGIAVPEQRVLATSADAAALDADALRFPLVLKPARSVAGGAKLVVRHAADAAQLRARLAELPDAAFPLLLQQRVVGPGVGVFALLWDGEPRALFAHRRIREKPPSGGVSVYRESIPADPELTRRAVALLRAFGWRGVAMVELKVDDATGTPYLMEVNGRFWGSLQLAVDAGVDFPALLLRAAEGAPATPPPAYRAGVRSRWWWGDVDHLIARLRRSPAELDLPPGAPGRRRAVLDFLTLWRPGDRNEVLRLDDPLPLLRETLDWLRRR